MTSVIRDKTLSDPAKTVFCELSFWVKLGEPEVSRGIRGIASNIGLHTATVQRSLHELAEHGHLKILSEGKQRGRYELLSPIYAEPLKPARRKKAA